MRRVLVIPFVVAAALVSAMPAFACTCVPFTPVQLAQESEVVFTGIARGHLGPFRGIEFGAGTVVEFEVEKMYKGPLARRIRIQAAGGRGPSVLGPGCEYGFEIGRRYTVFARDYDHDGVPNTNGCFQNVEGAIWPTLYGLPAGDVPPSSGDQTALLIAGAALVAFAALAIALERRHIAH